MARQSALSPAQWQQVRDLSIAGVQDADIIREYGDSGLSLAALKKRRTREEWPSPSMLAHTARRATYAVNVSASRRNVSNVPSALPADSAKLILDLAQGRTIASFGLLNQRVCSALDSAPVPETEHMRDLLQLVQIAERTARLDAGKGQTNVQVNVAVSPWQRSSRSSERVIDVEESQ